MTDTRTRILDAVLGEVAVHGLDRLGVEGVATRAGVSRQTVYRHFVTRDRLVEEAIVREEDELLREMLATSAREVTLEAAVEVAVATALQLSRRHPVLSQLLQHEPHTLLPYLLLGRGPVVSAAEPAVEDLVRRHRPDRDPTRLRVVADMATRLLVSYVVSPAEQLDDRDLAREMARVVVHLVDADAPAAPR